MTTEKKSMTETIQTEEKKATSFATMAEAINETIRQDPVADTNEETITEKPVFLSLRRERFKGKENGAMYWGYYVRGVMLGKELRASLKVSDSRGYDLLDLFFSACNGAAVVEIPYTIKNEMTGQIRRGCTYEAQVVDGDGEIIRVKISPAKESDKAILEYLFNKARAAKK